MLSLEFIRKNPDEVRRAAQLKGEPAPIDDILRLDAKWRSHQHKAESIKSEQNELSKEFARTRDEALKERLRQMADNAKSELSVADAVKRELDHLLLQVPNVFHESVPIGETEADNVVAREWGSKPELGFPPRTHYDLGEALGIMDFERAARVSGSRFAFLIGEGARLERTASGYTIRTERIVNAFDEQFVDLGLRLEGMDRQRIDVHALSLTAPMVYWASPGFGLALAQAYNDAATAAHARHPQRFVGLAMLPMQAPDLALKELERAAKLPGMRGMYLATHVNGIDLDDRRFWDVYAKAEELDWPVFLHPIDTIGRERTTRYYLRNLLGNPYDTGVAAASLIFGGVLDAFPKLEVNLPHAGGTFPWLIGRLDHGTKVRPELRHMKRLPSAYLRRFTYDTIGHNDQINYNLIRMVGADRVVLGSDYCFDMGLADPLGDVERLDALSAAERDLIIGETAVKLLRL